MTKSNLQFSLGKIVRKSQEILSSDYKTKVPDSFLISKSNIYAVDTLDRSSVYVSLRKHFYHVKDQLIERKVMKEDVDNKHVTIKDDHILRYNFDLIESLIIPELVIFHYLKPRNIWTYFGKDFKPRLSKRIDKYTSDNNFNIWRPYMKRNIPENLNGIDKIDIQNAIMGKLLNDLSFFFLQNAFITRRGKNIRSYAVNLGKKFPNFRKLKSSVHKRSKWPDELWPMFIVEDCEDVNTAFSVWLDTYIEVKTILSNSTNSPECDNSWKYYTKYHQITNIDIDKVDTYLGSLFPGYKLIGYFKEKIHISLEYELAQFAINFYDYKSPIPIKKPSGHSILNDPDFSKTNLAKSILKSSKK